MPPESISDPTRWNTTLASLPNAHLLQSWEWGELKSKYGWEAQRLIWKDGNETPFAAAQILQRDLLLPGISRRFSLLYCPRGPALRWSDPELRAQVLEDLQRITEIQKAVFLKIDPDLPISSVQPDAAQTTSQNPAGENTREALEEKQWRASVEQIQFRNTFLLDLSEPEDQLLSGMKQKTRYNIRLAGRRGVSVRLGDLNDFDLLYRMYAETSVRDGFAIREPGYYHDAWGSFIQAGIAQPLIAQVDETPVAAVIVYKFADTSLYMYGMSGDQHREKMPNYLLQWEAIRWSKDEGCKVYDFWGAPETIHPEDPLWGLYRFKSGFGTRFVYTLGAWDYVAKPIPYWLYTVIKPKALDLMRVIGRRKTKQSIDN
jgi:lipid II:glycine glycyltransferase (peptidoglycan interpeptide bridge formation enzyme)